MIAPDKRLHFMAGVVLASLGLLISPISAMIIVALIAAMKEFYDDVSERGTPDFMDFVWTLIGGAFPILAYFIHGWLL